MRTRKLLYIAPQAIAILVMLGGLLNIVSALIASPWVRAVQRLLPLEIFDASRTLTLISGVLLLILGHSLLRKKHRAWVLSTALIVISIFFNLVKGGDIAEVIALCVPLALLIAFRWEFTVRSVRGNFRQRLWPITAVGVILLFYIFLGFVLLQRQFREHVTFDRVTTSSVQLLTGLGDLTLQPRTKRAVWFENSIFTVGLVFIGIIFGSLFAPLIQTEDPTEDELVLLKKLQHEWGESSVSYFSLMDDKKYFFTQNGRAVVPYKIRNGSAVVLCEPICAPSDYEESIAEFLAYTKRCDLSTVFYLLSPQQIPVYKKLGLNIFKIGEEALIDIEHFSLDGPEMRDLRYSISHVSKSGIQFHFLPMTELPGDVRVEAHQMHEAWAQQQKVTQLTFSMDFYPFPEEKNGYVLIGRNQSGDVECLLSFLPYQNGRAIALDAMIRAEHPTKRLVEAAILHAVQFFKDKHVHTLSLGSVMLADSQLDPLTPTLIKKAKSLLFTHFNQFYNYQSLFAFKEKFHPEWQPRYIAFTSKTEVIKVIVAIIEACTKRPFTNHTH